jgi:hypothetical protein
LWLWPACAPDCFEAQVRIYDAMRRGDEAEAARLYRDILPRSCRRHSVRPPSRDLRNGRARNGN